MIDLGNLVDVSLILPINEILREMRYSGFFPVPGNLYCIISSRPLCREFPQIFLLVTAGRSPGLNEGKDRL